MTASTSATSVHPRVCGERARGLCPRRNPNGSSPRVRGTRSRYPEGHRRRRFIPACAGNAPLRTYRQMPRSVHPRVCGERKLSRGKFTAAFGSSPRVRGTPRRVSRRQGGFRFIPACAGNARPAGVWIFGTAVHPRVCGERVVRLVAVVPVRGSSPRVRGTPDTDGPAARSCRFIPACAGNAAGRARQLRANPVHPRVCGERASDPDTDARAAGSSPRVRGTPAEAPALLDHRRFIPACAGNARVRRGRSPARAVHPRVCGERAGDVRELGQQVGSSPRVRGTPLLSRLWGRVRRFIPACAGNATWFPSGT